MIHCQGVVCEYEEQNNEEKNKNPRYIIKHKDLIHIYTNQAKQFPTGTITRTGFIKKLGN